MFTVLPLSLLITLKPLMAQALHHFKPAALRAGSGCYTVEIYKRKKKKEKEESVWMCVGTRVTPPPERRRLLGGGPAT